ncbi:hypothetical protein NC652_008230 [Populus alba x Populus x berolinensis]|nr:hypothetical protein NC652_008230 [Populus alba x Populus x berolinensis]
MRVGKSEEEDDETRVRLVRSMRWKAMALTNSGFAVIFARNGFHGRMRQELQPAKAEQIKQ